MAEDAGVKASIACKAVDAGANANVASRASFNLSTNPQRSILSEAAKSLLQ
jgi:hypothetical protein